MSPSPPKLLRGLNDAQREAVVAGEGPVLVLAGAGTGKTRVITVRIAWLMDQGVKPENILAVTFTNKAAAEMRERIAGIVGKKRAKDLRVSTFHKFCLLTLREFGTAVGLPQRFTICDDSDQLAAAKAALRELSIPEATVHPNALRSRISLEKSRNRGWQAVLDAPGDENDELIGRAWKRYEERLSRVRSVDFDDLLTLTLKLLREHDDVRDELRARHRHVLVDEYQDTNGPQYEILRGIAGGHRNVCVVGDDDQSIYGWRGADVRKILNFENDFPGAKVVRLETNYRSTSDILDTAWKLISKNPDRHEKRLRSHLGDGDKVRGYQLEDETEEARFVAHEIATAVNEREARLGDFAILFRTQTQPRAFEGELRARAIPYRLVGGMSFFDRKEVRDVLAYLKLTQNPDDEVSFLRVLNSPPRGIGKTSIERLVTYATENKISVPQTLDPEHDVPDLTAAARDAGRGLRDLIKTLAAKDPGSALVAHVEKVLDAVGYRSEVERVYKDPREIEDRWASVEEILNFAANHVKRQREPNLVDFLSELALTAADDRDEDGPAKDQVTLMTLHAAKGLEFPRVFLVGMEEGLLPHSRSVAEDTVPEERRLAYVGITRAQRNLTMTWTKQRAKYGRFVPSHASRFLFEMQDIDPPKGWVAAGQVAPAPAPKKGRGKGTPRKRKATGRRKAASKKAPK